MMIRPSTAIRNEYNEISRTCHESGQPIFITKNGEGDLVVQSLAAYNRREASLELREKLFRRTADFTRRCRGTLGKGKGRHP